MNHTWYESTLCHRADTKIKGWFVPKSQFEFYFAYRIHWRGTVVARQNYSVQNSKFNYLLSPKSFIVGTKYTKKETKQKTYVIFNLKELLDPINVHYSCFLNFTENAKFLSSISKRGNKSVISSLGDPKHFFWSQMKPKLKHTIDIEQSVLIVERDNIFKEQWMCSLQLGLIFQESKDKYICNLFF